jgi:hypothetical protein
MSVRALRCAAVMPGGAVNAAPVADRPRRSPCSLQGGHVAALQARLAEVTAMALHLAGV